MAKKLHKPEEIIAKLRQVDVWGIARQVGGRFRSEPSALTATKKFGAPLDPSRTSRSDSPAAGRDAMDVGMVGQRLPPGCAGSRGRRSSLAACADWQPVVMASTALLNRISKDVALILESHGRPRSARGNVETMWK